ncbi:unnamed protein product [Orchesella dallaii]|uniref:Homeobox domain-containing protein n=1 Tax=Orchesella dallaii TaxID=48710 RepID=A0ABP1R320_9HEXA
MHHKPVYYYGSEEEGSPLKFNPSSIPFAILASGEKISLTEQMCEAKMEQEPAESDKIEAKSPPPPPPPQTTILSSHCHKSLHHNHHGKGQPLTPNSQDDEMSSDDLISVGGSPSPSLTSPDTLSRANTEDCCSEDEYFRPLKKLRMLQVESPGQSSAGVKSFSITDILSHKPAKSSNGGAIHKDCSASAANAGRHPENVAQQRIVRPWDAQNKTNGRRNSSDSSPLDALFQMTSKTFEGLNGHHENSESGGSGNTLQIFNPRQPPKKKRKSRTAFTNHQIFELEKRFLYQKYLSPADRDDIAQQLGLTNAQVITWFQNRRAKLKRDMEELKKDVESAKLLSAHKSFLESAHDLGLLKKRTPSQMDMSPAAAAYHISSPTSSSQSSHSPINLTSESPPSTH